MISDPFYPFNKSSLSFEEYADIDMTNYMDSIKKAANEWDFFILHKFDDLRLDTNTIRAICIYIEISLRYLIYKNEMMDRKPEVVDSILSGIRSKILENCQKRSRIMSKVYNYVTGKIEYELEDGNYIPLDGKSKLPFLVDADLSKIFPEVFMKHLDISGYRNNRIIKITEEDGGSIEDS